MLEDQAVRAARFCTNEIALIMENQTFGTANLGTISLLPVGGWVLRYGVPVV